MQRKGPRSFGFSLVDVVVALGILIVAAGALGVFVYATIVRQSVGYEAQAARISTDELEALKRAPWDTSPASGTLQHPSIEELPNGSGTFTLSAPTSSGALREAEVTVQWTDRGKTRTYTQTTYVAEDGI